MEEKCWEELASVLLFIFIRALTLCLAADDSE